MNTHPSYDVVVIGGGHGGGWFWYIPLPDDLVSVGIVADPAYLFAGDARAFLDPIYSSGLFLALGSAELAAGSIESALAANDTSAAKLGTFEPALWAGGWRLLPPPSLTAESNPLCRPRPCATGHQGCLYRSRIP